MYRSCQFIVGFIHNGENSESSLLLGDLEGLVAEGLADTTFLQDLSMTALSSIVNVSSFHAQHSVCPISRCTRTAMLVESLPTH